MTTYRFPISGELTIHAGDLDEAKRRAHEIARITFFADQDRDDRLSLLPGTIGVNDQAMLGEALDRVLEIHQPIDAMHYAGRTQTLRKVCTGCGTDDGNWQIWPCPTIRAIDRSTP